MRGVERHPRLAAEGLGRGRIPRNLHPVAWWLWAVLLAAAVSQTTNPILLGISLAVLGFVVTNRRTDAPWARAFKYYLYLALTVVAIRVVFRSVFGGDVGGPGSHVMFELPRIGLPKWMAGVQIGGPVTVEGTLSAVYDGLRLACLLCCLGVANALANPKRALRALPGALYELGVAVVVAFNVGPQLIESVQRVRAARKLRGGGKRGAHLLRTVAIPVLEDAFERSLRLAAAMDSRGYGRTRNVSRRVRRTTGALMLSGMSALCVGAYGLLDPTTTGPMGAAGLAVGAALCTCGLVVGGKGVKRTSYRPDPWKVAEWGVVFTGLVPLVVLVSGLGTDAAALNPSTSPITWPVLPAVPAAAFVFAALAGVISPPPLRSSSRTSSAPPLERIEPFSAELKPANARRAEVRSDPVEVKR